MPIRSPRAVYAIAAIGQNLDDDPNQVDDDITLREGGTVIEVYAKIKLGIGKYFGLTPLAFNDPIFTGTFKSRMEGGAQKALNDGSEYRRQIGGFRVASYTLIAKSLFEIEEEYFDRETKEYVTKQSEFRSMSIGLPKGHSVHEFITWMKQWQNSTNIASIVTPKGRRIDTTVRLGG